MSSAIRIASSMSVSTIWDSGTVLMTSPLTKIWPLPLPEATPRSASRASPGPLTTQPMTATRSGTVRPFQTGGHLVGEGVDVDLGAPARRARHDLQTARRRPSDSRIWLPTLTSSTGGADSETRIVSPMPSASSAPNADRRLDGALERRSRLGDAEVQGVVALLGQQPVGVDHHDRVVVLHRDLDVAEPVLLEERALPERRLDQRLGRRLAVLGEQPLVQRCRRSRRSGSVRRRRRPPSRSPDLVVERLDVAGVDAHGGAAGVDGREDVLGLEVDVGDHRYLRLASRSPAARRRRPGSGRQPARSGSRCAVSSAICCSVALMSVVGVVVIDCTEHRCVATDQHPTHVDLPRLASLGERAVGDLGHRRG